MKKVFDKEKAMCVLKICNTEGKNIANFYSTFIDDRKSERQGTYSASVNGLRSRILKLRYVGTDNYGGAAIFLNKKVSGNDSLLAKFDRKGELIEKNY